MSADDPLATRELPDLSQWSLSELRRDGDSPLDLALDRALSDDAATSGTSSGFQNRL
jgi:hypothetical protein